MPFLIVANLVLILYTVEDFLVHDIYALEAFARRDNAPDKLKQVSCFCSCIDVFDSAKICC